MNTHQRLSAVQKALSSIGIDKSGKNQQQGYKYRGIDQVMNALAPLLAEHELLIMPNVLSHKFTEGTTRNGGAMYHHMVEVEYTIFGPEGDSIGPFRARGECIDTADKGLNKACTAAYKYWVLTALCIPTEASEDADETTHEVGHSTITQEQQNELIALMMQSNTEAPEFLKWLNITALNQLATEHFDTAKNALQKKLDIMAREYEAGEKGGDA